jgi:uncharacterized protein YecT (DUF1311 family)
MSLVLVASATQWACVDEARTEAAAANARDSALVHDLVLAGYDSAATKATGRYFGPTTTGATVTESPGALADAPVGAPATSSATRVDPAPTSSSAASTPTSSADSAVGPSCASPTAEDQQRCLRSYLARSDAQLNQSYQALITVLKAEAGTRGNAPEPATVRRLRNTQRNWVTYRDDECRKRTASSEGPLWAPVRAKCLGEYSALRQREFDEALAKRKVTVAKSAPAKPKATKRTKRKARSKRLSWGQG